MTLPLSMAELTALSITQLQQHLQRGELAAREIADITLDATRLRGDVLPPLAGVPYAVKNLFDVAGETTLAGAQLFAEHPPAKRDAFALRQLSASGALLSGMLNMDAYAYGFTTENSHYGPTRHPLDPTSIAGGSSGGSAAAVGAGLVHFSLGIPMDRFGCPRRCAAFLV